MYFTCINRTDEYSKKIEEKLIKDMISKGFILNDLNPDYVFSIGGDGTFLLAVNKYYNKKTTFININTGSFGYLSEFEVDEIPTLINSLNKYKSKSISLLELNYSLKDDNKNKLKKNKLYALNEFRIHSKHGKTLSFDVYINDTFLESLRGDGIIVSSSIGSSGIARSQGGALVDNEIEMIQIVEEAPILNYKYGSLHSSFVLSKYNSIKLKNFNLPFHIFYDSSNIDCYDLNTEIEIKLSKKKIKVLKNPSKNYIEKTSKLFTK